jgi:hypothetical protein
LCLDKKYYVEIQNIEFQWMFCKYFWESHSLLPNIPIDQLELLESTNTRKMTKPNTKSKKTNINGIAYL